MKKNIKDIVILIICLLVIIAVFIFGMVYIKPAADDITLMDKGFRNLNQVNVYAGVKNGRGFIFEVEDECLYILTSKHLVSEENQVTVEFGNKGKVQAEVVYYFVDNDAALIRVKREDSDLHLKGAKGVVPLTKEEYGHMPLNKSVLYATDIYDTSLEVRTGKWYSSLEYIYELGEETGIFLGEVLPGMSGGALYDEEDRLVGMIIAADETKGAVIPSYVLDEEYGKFKGNE